MTEPSQEQIAHRSYLIWEQEGHPHGHALDHWLQAERELQDLFNPEPRPPFNQPKTARKLQKKAASATKKLAKKTATVKRRKQTTAKK